MIADESTLSHLLGLAQQGDKTAYTVLLGAARAWLQRYFARRIPPHQLDDLIQDTLLSVHRKLATCDASRPFLPWLAAIARYRWVDQLRRTYRADEVPMDEEYAALSEEPAISARISLDRLFQHLSSAQAEVIELVKIKGLSVTEAALATGQSESLIKVNIHRGLKRLSALIENA